MYCLDQYQRIAAFLTQYCSREDGNPVLPPDPEYLKSAIALLIDEGVMTADEIRAEALDEFDVIIPSDWFPKKEET